jgi:hypothetical protein
VRSAARQHEPVSAGGQQARHLQADAAGGAGEQGGGSAHDRILVENIVVNRNIVTKLPRKRPSSLRATALRVEPVACISTSG